MSHEAFVIGTRKKYRFKTTNGNLTIYDLWDLSLEELNDIAITIDDQIEKAPTKSFIKTVRNVGNKDLKNRLEIVKHIIDVKLFESEKKDLLAANKERRAKLVAKLEETQAAKLDKLTEADIIAELEAMDKEESELSDL